MDGNRGDERVGEGLGGVLAEPDGGSELAIVLEIDAQHWSVAAYGYERAARVAVNVMDRVQSRLHADEFVQRSDFGGVARFRSAIQRAELRPLLADVVGVHLIDLDGNSYVMDVSMGVALGSELPQVVSFAQLTEFADAALCMALRRRSKVAFADAEVLDMLRDRVDLTQRLKHSADDDFVLVYQPLVSVPDRKVLGFESLLRWRTPGGVLAPDAFMSVAEDASLIIPIGRRAIGQAVAALASEITPRFGSEAFVSINLSGQQLLDDGIAAYIGQLIDEHGVNAEQVWVELRENAVIQVDSVAAQNIESLHDLGCRICVDDLGSGFSALSYARDLPVDVLKVDRSLVADLDSDTFDRSLVQAICEMAKALGIVTVAEGVENERVVPELVALGFDIGQGYFFGRPGDPATVFDGAA